MANTTPTPTENQLDLGQLTAQQLTAPFLGMDEPINPSDATLLAANQSIESETTTLIDIHTVHVTAEINTRHRLPAIIKQRSKQHRRNGGWPTTRYMSSKDVRLLLDGIHQLARQKKQLTHFVTLRPPPGIYGDQPQKMWCRRQMQNIQRKFVRRRMKFIACYVYEKSENGPVYVHLLVHAPKRASDLLGSMHNLPDIDVKPAQSHHVSYIVKNRRWTGPKCEKWLRDRFGLRWRKGAGFRGKRWDWTRDAKQLLTMG